MSNQTKVNVYVPTIEDIHQIYKKYSNIDILSNNRTRNVVEHRCMFANLCREYTDSSLFKIGKYFNRDHSTVLHYIKQFNIMAKYNKSAMKAYMRTEQEIMEQFPLLFKHPDERKIATDTSESERRRSLRRLHAATVKMNFYKQYTRNLERQIKRLKAK